MNQKALLEAALFVSDKPLTLQRLARVVGIGSEQQVRELLEELKQQLQSEDRGIELVETPQGFELRVKPAYRKRVARLAPFSDLSDGMLRTLAIIALKQPIKQSVVVKYQGNKVYGYVRDLEAKGLIRAEKFSRTKLLSTTDDFEKYFGKSINDIQKMLDEKLSGE